MRRHNLLLLIIVPLLLLLTLTQLIEAQGVTPRAASRVGQGQPIEQAEATPEPTELTDEEAAAADALELEAGEPLSQPLGIRIRQTVPITVLLDLFGLVMDAPVPPAIAAIDAAPVPPVIAPTVTVTTSVAVSGLEAVTATQVITSQPPITLPDTITATLDLTSAASLTEVESLPLEIPDADVTPEEPAADATDTPAAAEETGASLTGDVTDADTDADAEDAAAAPSLVDIVSDARAADDTVASVPLTVELDLSFLVTDTLTSTVPARLALRFAGDIQRIIPITIEVANLDTALVTVTPLTSTEAISAFFGITTTAELTGTDALTATDGLTATEDVTDSEGITISSVVTVTGTLTPTPAPLVPVTVTVPVTANVRADADLNGEIARTVPPQTVLTIVAINAAGDWLLLDDGNWLATVVLGQAPANLAAATDELVTQLREAAALATPTPTPILPTETPVPVIVPSGPVTGTTTTNANLRAGPGTEFDITGATVFGQLITIVARNEAGDWLLLDTGAWISTPLVANLPAIEAITLFDPNATPVAPVTEPVTTTAPLTTTEPITAATPEPAPPGEGSIVLPTATPRPPNLGVDENIYLIEFDTINTNYQRALTAIDRLIDSAAGNEAIFTDATWTTDMNTAIALLRNASSAVGRLTVPEAFTAAHNSLTTAAAQYTTAADLLSTGMEQSDAAQFDAAFSAITLGDASLAQAAAALASFRP